MVRAMITWYALFSSTKIRAHHMKLRDLIGTKWDGFLAVGSSSAKFLAKGYCVHKKFYVDSITKLVICLEETSVGGYQTEKPLQAQEFLYWKETFKNMMWGGCHIFGCLLPLPWQLLAYSGLWVWLFRSASAHWVMKYKKCSQTFSIQAASAASRHGRSPLCRCWMWHTAAGRPWDYPEPLIPAARVAQWVSLGAVLRRGPGTAGFRLFLRQDTGEICTGRDLGKMISHQHASSTEQQGCVWDPFSWLNTHCTVQFNSFSCQFYSSLT